jgi:phage I-like protein
MRCARSARREKAERLVDAIRAGKLLPAQRAWATAYCAADAAGFRAFVARQPVVYRRRSSRGESRRDGRGSMLAQTETAISAQLGLKHSDFLKRKHGSGHLLCLAREGAES